MLNTWTLDPLSALISPNGSTAFLHYPFIYGNNGSTAFLQISFS